MIVRRAGLAALLLVVLGLLGLAGCGQLGYLAQAGGGHLALVNAARPVEDWLADPALDPGLRQRLLLAQRLRQFAVSELQLPDNASYRRYADLGRPAAVWNVVAAPALGLELKTWCYPLMGCAGYRGFFKRAEAEDFGQQLRQQGWEVWVYGVPAYSSLGWSNWLGGDPLLNTFIGYEEGDLAAMIFHELAHQVAYAADDTVFNESFATAVERLGTAAWLAQPGQAAARERHAASQQRRSAFRALTRDYRERLQALYAGPLPEDEKRSAKARLFEELRRAGSAQAGYQAWFAQANNASLAIQAAYADLSPAFEALFERQGRDWPRFFAEVRRLAELPYAQRRAELGH